MPSRIIDDECGDGVVLTHGFWAEENILCDIDHDLPYLFFRRRCQATEAMTAGDHVCFNRESPLVGKHDYGDSPPKMISCQSAKAGEAVRIEFRFYQ